MYASHQNFNLVLILKWALDSQAMEGWFPPWPQIHSNTVYMDIKKTIELLSAKGDSRMTTEEALVVVYMNEDEGIIDAHIAGDIVNIKRALITIGKTNGFLRKIIFDAADALKVATKK